MTNNSRVLEVLGHMTEIMQWYTYRDFISFELKFVKSEDRGTGTGLSSNTNKPGWTRNTSRAVGARLLLVQEPPSPAVSPLGAARHSAGSPSPLRGSPCVDSGPYPNVTASVCYSDAGLALGASFRAGWGPGGKLVFPGRGMGK